MTKKTMVMHPDDNVATVLEKVDKGEELQIEIKPGTVESVTTLKKIKFLHKVAIKDIPAGTAVVKYGQIIGKATDYIQKGSHVHTKNVKSWFYS